MTTIEQIKEECRAIIALAEKATPGPWVHNVDQGHVGDVSTPDTDSIAMTQERVEIARRVGEGHRAEQNKQRNINASFIAASRSVTPKAARATLFSIEEFESDMANEQAHCVAWHCARVRLETICREREESKN